MTFLWVIVILCSYFPAPIAFPNSSPSWNYSSHPPRSPLPHSPYQTPPSSQRVLIMFSHTVTSRFCDILSFSISFSDLLLELPPPSPFHSMLQTWIHVYICTHTSRRCIVEKHMTPVYLCLPYLHLTEWDLQLHPLHYAWHHFVFLYGWIKLHHVNRLHF